MPTTNPNSAVIATDYCETCGKITRHGKRSNRKLTRCYECPYAHVPTEKFTIIQKGYILGGIFIETFDDPSNSIGEYNDC